MTTHPRFTTLNGQTFGRLRVLSTEMREINLERKKVCEVECAPDLGGCGTRKVVRASALVTGMCRSCGCLRDQGVRERNRGRVRV